MKKGILIFYNNLPFLKSKLLKCSALALDSVLSNDCVPGKFFKKAGVNLAQKKGYNIYLYTNSPASSSPLWVLTFWQNFDAFS